jgi:hypothetical protein
MNHQIYKFLTLYSCDISDALLNLKHPHGGFLPGLASWSPQQQEGPAKLIGPAYTVKFAKHEQTDAPVLEKHYVSGCCWFTDLSHLADVIDD